MMKELLNDIEGFMVSQRDKERMHSRRKKA